MKEVIIVNKSKNATYWKNKTITLLTLYKKNKKDKTYILEVLYAITNWVLNIDNIDSTTLVFSSSTKDNSHINSVSINNELFNQSHKLSKFTALVDSLLNNLNSVISSLDSSSSSFSLYKILYNIANMCKLNYEDAATLAIGMYMLNKEKNKAKVKATTQLAELNKTSVFKKDKIIPKMIHIQKKIRSDQQKIYKENIEIFSSSKEYLIEKIESYKEIHPEGKLYADEILDILQNDTL